MTSYSKSYKLSKSIDTNRGRMHSIPSTLHSTRPTSKFGFADSTRVSIVDVVNKKNGQVAKSREKLKRIKDAHTTMVE